MNSLDRLSASLLRELIQNGRASLVELSQRVGLSPTACARRQKILEEDGIITGYRAELDHRALGLDVTVIVRISLDSQREEALHEFERAIAGCSAVVRCFLMSGTDDYLVTVIARDIADYEHIHKSQLSRLPHVLRLQSSFALRQIIERSALSSVVGSSRRPNR
jgi:Lrp/AsnC family transcriptional regulator, leucine-responsive regulatory protein